MKFIPTTLLFIAFLFTTSAFADHSPQHNEGSDKTQTSSAQAPSENPLELLKQGLVKLQQFARQNSQNDPDMLQKFIEEDISPYFDFDLMASWTTRPYYAQMNPQQQAIVRNKMKNMFLTTLTQQLGTFTNPLPRVDFLNPVQISPNEIQIAARVLPTYGYPVRLGFRFYRTPKGWKVIDATSNGTSAIFYYRQYFIDLVNNFGPQALLQ